jgi:hypothetical protein
MDPTPPYISAQHGTIPHAPPAYLAWILLFVSQGELAAAEVAAEAGERGEIDSEGGEATPRLMTVLQQSNRLIQVRALWSTMRASEGE